MNYFSPNLFFHYRSFLPIFFYPLYNVAKTNVCLSPHVCKTVLECTMTEFRVKDFAVNQLHEVNDEGN